jgi:hypothetical protein
VSYAPHLGLILLRFYVLSLTQQGLHLWLQSSPQGGKFYQSDVFVMLDFRIPFSASMLLHADSTESEKRLLRYECPIALPQHETSPSLVYHTYDEPHDDTESMYTWQYNLADYCHLHNLSGPSNSEFCMQAVSQVYHCVYMHTLLKKEHLPGIQVMPSPEYPFVFLHIEKAGGTSLRR